MNSVVGAASMSVRGGGSGLGRDSLFFPEIDFKICFTLSISPANPSALLLVAHQPTPLYGKYCPSAKT